MMNLFEKLPDNFFSILSSKNKNIYGIALVTLYEALTMYRNRIRKTDYLDLLKSRGEKEVSLFSFDEEDIIDDTSLIYESTIASKANYVLRKLIETGWVLIEQNVKTGAEYLLLPTYSISMLKIIYEFMNSEENKYVSYVHSTYSDLKLEDELQDEFMYKTLESAYNNTKTLEIEVAKLDHSIRVFKRQLSNIFSPNEVLSQHFDNAREDVVDPIYHPLKTNDSIILYQGPITSILKKWLITDEVREKLVEQNLHENRMVKNHLEAEADIIKKINYIQDTYQRLSNEIGEIDKTQSEYIKASTEKVIYLNNSDKSIRGKLETIFLACAKTIAGEKKGTYPSILKDINNSALFYQQGYFDSDSVAKPYRRNFRDDSEPLALDDYEHEKNEGLMQSLINITEAYSEESIMEFMKEKFKDKDELPMKNTNIKDIEEFIMLILASAKANSHYSFYGIEHPKDDDVRQIIVNEFNVPNYTYYRKEESK